MAALAVAMAVLQLITLLLSRGLGLRLQRLAVISGLVLPWLVLCPWIMGGRLLLPTCVQERALPLAPRLESSTTHRSLNDAVLQFLPWEADNRRALAAGRLPLYSDVLEGGSAPLSNPQACVLCPIAMLARLAPIEHHLLVVLALKMLLAFQGLWLLARLLGAPRVPCLLAGGGYALAGGLAAWALFPHSTAAAWAPWLVVATIRIFRRPQARGIATTAVITAALLLAGHPEVALAGGLLAVTCGPSLWRRRTGFWRGLGAAAAAAALGVGLAAPHLLPFLGQLPHCQRYEQTLEESQEPDEMVWYRPDSWFTTGTVRSATSLANPVAFGRPYGHKSTGWTINAVAYGGLLCFAGWIGALLARRRKMLPFLGFGVFGLLLAYRFTPLFVVAQTVPLFKTYTGTRILLVVVLCLSACAAIGLGRLLSRRQGPRPWIALAVAATLSLLVARPPAVLLLWGGIAIAAVVARFRPRWAELILCLVLLADLVPWARAMLPVGNGELFYPRTRAVRAIEDELAGDGQWRMAGFRTTYYPELLGFYGINDVRYHNPMTRADYAHALAAAFDFHAGDWSYFSSFGNPDHPLLDFLGVRLLASKFPCPTQTLQEIERPDLWPVRLFRNPDALPRCFLPVGARVVAESQVLAEVAAMQDPRQVIVAEQDLGGWKPPGLEWDRSAVHVTSLSPGHLRLGLACREQPLLLATSLPSPDGWRATAGGEGLATIRINGAFLGVVLPAGVAEVELLFVPPGFHLGLGLCFAAVLVVLLLASRPPWARIATVSRRRSGGPAGKPVTAANRE